MNKIPAAPVKTKPVAQSGNFFGKENSASFFGKTLGNDAAFFSGLPVQRKCRHCEEEDQLLQRKENNAAAASEVNISGTGSFTKNTVGYGNCENVSLVEGETKANYTNSFSANSPKVPATGCTDCAGADCISSSGTVISVFNAAPTITLPAVPSGLNPCERIAVRNFINGTLRAHERRHVNAFNTYKGTVRTPYNFTGCKSDLDTHIQSVHDDLEVSRRDASDAASAALDANGANQFTFDCDCPDPEPHTP